ncbi:MAG: cytochrome D1 domain-containing protein [Geminicoccaceae bacterium]
MRSFRLSLAALALMPAFASADAEEAADLYVEHCAECHGADRLGGTGPALIPQNLGRLKPEKATAAISEGRTQTQMPAFADVLDDEQIEALITLIFEPLPEMPTLDIAAIEATRIVTKTTEQIAAAPVHDGDLMNLFVVVESGDHHVTILDGDRFEPITRFPSRYALHGGPKFSPDGRFVHFASRDGWITRYDLWGLETVAEVRAGINTRNIAISADGTVLAVANYLPHSLVLLDAATLAPLKVIETTDLRGEESSRVSAVYQAAPRDSFVVALKDIPELWEVSYADPPPEGYGSFVHSHETGMVEAADEGRFPIRRTELKEPLDDFFFDQSYRHVIGSARDGGRGVVVQLDVRREIAELPLPGLPHLGSGISWDWQGKRVMATPHLKEGVVSVIDMADWQVVKTIETEGPGFFMRSHQASPYAFVDVFFGPNKDAVHVIDKATLEVTKTLRPAPGKTAAHVEFTRDGRHALLSIWDMDGAVIVYDAETLKEVKRLPMVKPSGKYNVWNKISRDEGTSH